MQATIEQSLKWKRFYHPGDEKPYTITKFDMGSKKLEIVYPGGEDHKVNLENYLADHSVD